MIIDTDKLKIKIKEHYEVLNKSLPKLKEQADFILNKSLKTIEEMEDFYEKNIIETGE